MARGTRMNKRWNKLGTNIAQSVSADVTGVVAGSFSYEEPFTVLRIMGEYQIFPSAVNVIDDQCAWTLGIGVFSTDAVTLGGTAMPDPEDEAEFPWLFWASHTMTMQVAQQHSNGDPQMALRRTYDVKTMRKVKPRETVVQVFQFRDIQGAPTYDLVFGRARILIATT